MKRVLPILKILLIALIGLSIYLFPTKSLGQFSVCGVPISNDNCADTYTGSICQLDGYKGSTLGFTVGSEDVFFNNFCGPGTGVQNSQWMSFVAETPSVELYFTLANCITGDGIQAAIVETDCSTFANILSCVGAIPFGSTAPFSLIATGLIPGDVYYLLVDSFAGDACDFSLEVIEGLPEDNIEIQTFTSPLCSDGAEATISAFVPPPNNYFYQWYDPQGNLIPNENGFDITVSEPGNYLAVARDFESCCAVESFATIEVVDDAPVGTITNSPETLILGCNNPEVTLSGEFAPVLDGRDYYYTWLDANGTNLGPGTNSPIYDITVYESGEYTFWVWDQETNCINEKSIEVTTDNLFDINFESNSGNYLLDCNYSEIELNAIFDSSPNTTVEWSNSSSNVLSNSNSIIISEANIYTFSVLDINQNCLAKKNILIEENFATPEINLPAADTLICNTVLILCDIGDCVNYNINYAYQWFASSGNLESNDLTFAPTTTGTYTLIVTDTQNGCTNSASINVFDNTLTPTPIITGETTLCMGSNTSGCIPNYHIYPVLANFLDLDRKV